MVQTEGTRCCIQYFLLFIKKKKRGVEIVICLSTSVFRCRKINQSDCFAYDLLYWKQHKLLLDAL